MNKLERLYRSAANWRVPLPWWFKGATFGLVFWGATLIVLSVVVIDDYQHAEHMDAWLIVGWFAALFFIWRAALTYRDLPRYWDCDEPANWETMTPDPFNDVTSTGKSSTGIVFSTYRDGEGNDYVRYIDPDGSVSWKRFRWRKRNN